LDYNYCDECRQVKREHCRAAMTKDKVTIGFVRRGFSASGGAENYLKRLAAGVAAAGYEAHLFTSEDWPASEWNFGLITRLRARSPVAFADRIEAARLEKRCHLLVSLERIWRCDVYRAGDGVHRAWLQHRRKMLTPLRQLTAGFRRKHRDIVRLEEALFRDRAAGRVIANSRMVKNEIAAFYNYPPEKIELIYNGVPLDAFRPSTELRAAQRSLLGLSEHDIALLFVGSGWERKGLRQAVQALEACSAPRLQLFVAGRGNEREFRARGVHFCGVVRDMPALYAAADIFVLPTFYDPFSNACLEALAAGLPVITTRANGFHEIIEQGVHGAIIDEASDVEAIARTIKFWSEPARRKEARPAILERASQFDISKNVDRTLAVLLQEAAASADAASGKMRKT